MGRGNDLEPLTRANVSDLPAIIGGVPDTPVHVLETPEHNRVPPPPPPAPASPGLATVRR